MLFQNGSPSTLQFKDQVVREVVDRMCSEFSGQCCTHKASDPPAEEPSTSGTQKATSSTTQRASSSTPNCSSCKGPATGGGYQCRWESLQVHLLEMFSGNVVQEYFINTHYLWYRPVDHSHFLYTASARLASYVSRVVINTTPVTI